MGLERFNAYLVSLAKKLNSSNFSIIKIYFYLILSCNDKFYMVFVSNVNPLK